MTSTLGALARGTVVLAFTTACIPPHERPAPTPAPEPGPERSAPLFRDGVPIGEVRARFEPDASRDGRFVRLTAWGPRVRFSIDRPVPAPANAPRAAVAPAAYDLGGDGTVERFEVCFDAKVVPLTLNRNGGADPSPSGPMVVSGKTFTFDGAELCFDQGDVMKPIVVFAAHWDAPDGTRVVVQQALGASSPLTLHAEPPLPMPALLALLL